MIGLSSPADTTKFTMKRYSAVFNPSITTTRVIQIFNFWLAHIVPISLIVVIGTVNICTGVCALGSDDVCSLCMSVLLLCKLGVEHARQALRDLSQLITATNHLVCISVHDKCSGKDAVHVIPTPSRRMGWYEERKQYCDRLFFVCSAAVWTVDQKFASFFQIRVEMVGIDDVMKMGVCRKFWRDKSQYLF